MVCRLTITKEQKGRGQHEVRGEHFVSTEAARGSIPRLPRVLNMLRDIRNIIIYLKTYFSVNNILSTDTTT